jgi:tripartite-type tricarboxylate transporter receptor subunit TctC
MMGTRMTLLKRLISARSVSAILAAGVLGLVALAPAARAADAADFFKGRVITYVVATAPGGGYDTYGRLIARFMQAQLPGSKIIVRNMPGAGHIVGANMIYAANPDGLTFGTFNTGLLFQQLMKDKGIRFDLTKMSWIGTAASDTRVLVLRKGTGITDPKQLFDTSRPKLKLFAAGVGSAAYFDVKIAVYALHMNVDLIPGYNGNEGTMSMLRQETDGTIGSESSNSQFVEQGNGSFILEFGGPAGSKIPQAENYATSDDSKKLLAILGAESKISRLTAGPPGIPADRLDVLRKAYMAALADPALLAQAKKMQIPIEPIDGDQTAKVITAALQQSPENLKLLTEAMKAK